jgi:glycosyltransferase involved in cell wall biosynthesis
MLLPGLGRVQRGAETAFLEIGRRLANYPGVSVTLFGSGPNVPAGLPIEVVPTVPREQFERWPTGPGLRSEYCYEELSFILRLTSRRTFRPRDFDVALHCSFPFTNWFLKAMARRGGPRSVFVTQNGDWMCRAESREYRLFRCDGLVCTNPEYYARHRDRYRSVLIPNGVDPDVYKSPELSAPESPDPRFPAGKKVVLMVSAMIPSKRVADGVRAVARVPDAFLVIAGDGPGRADVRAVAEREMPGRFLLLGSVPRSEMPDLYRRADAFLHMSQDEPSCISYLEAAASGLPMVLHDAPVPRWTLGTAALYADTSDLAAVTHAVRAAVAPEARDRLGSAARRRVLDGWTWDALADKYRWFLESLVHSPQPAEVQCSR